MAHNYDEANAAIKVLVDALAAGMECSRARVFRILYEEARIRYGFDLWARKQAQQAQSALEIANTQERRLLATILANEANRRSLLFDPAFGRGVILWRYIRGLVVPLEEWDAAREEAVLRGAVADAW